ncbi:MAG: helix-turn-helix domain-containing protein [Candidatus Accumulibacter sp.]|jgi:DNA-binding transcriptional regulator YdaS (Cro superfamily)|nr:helix-turn-helix domain-containing protein [Accumulibacter sp.]
MESSIERAVQAVGSQSALARAVNVTPQAVQQWVEAGRVSHKKVIDVERVSGVPRQELRPDIYPTERGAAA